ncbi:cytochrome P450 [Obba rivulosa]|uniref:Cytochrome P450 n=1 Tax=Obba rivulosa TaxID=1052685 RepID=A0A8E2DTS3_9APHY|nr:cytochrome P450 [Obba rivulosa]
MPLFEFAGTARAVLAPCVYLGCLVLLYLFLRRSKRSRLPFPPGPKSSWRGSVQLPKAYQWFTYADWRKIYGDVIYVRIFGNPIVILNSARVADDLLNKRSSIYSSRPVRTMVYDLMGWSWLFSTQPYGTWWRKHRTLFHQHFQVNSIEQYYPVQLKESYVMLRNLLDSPENFYLHIRRTTAAIVIKITYGHQIAPEGDWYVALADKAITTLGKAGIFGTYIVDYLPFLKHVPEWFPGAGFKRQAAEWRQWNREMLNRPFDMVKEQVLSGKASIPSIAAAELETWLQSGQDPEYEELVKNICAIVYAAGSDTTVTAIHSFFLAMLVHPEVLTKAQEEIDRVIGKDRLPTFEDRDSLPYIDWVVWECLRWIPVTPLGIAHSNIEEDVYNDYCIPKGTTILTNVWGMLHDEATYPEPFRFYPDRYADSKSNAELGINELPWISFGFGRRMCPGRYLAINTVWITVATTAAAFNIKKPLDENGVPIEPVVQSTPGSLVRPLPFQCCVMPRSEAAAALIRQATEDQ